MVPVLWVGGVRGVVVAAVVKVAAVVLGRGSPLVVVAPVVGVSAVVVAASGGGSGGVGSCGCLHTTAHHNVLRIVPHLPRCTISF